uniref:Suppressor of forked domain-containing protein n=1 Tax=Ditylenchus dipsaci TaxID=166011 RepID=A0A915CZX8_9BILA
MMDQDTSKNKNIRLPKKAEKVKNKAAAGLQITAEQLLREAKERDLEAAPAPPRVRVTDPEEAAELNRKKRKEFEDNIRKNHLWMWTIATSLLASICRNGNEMQADQSCSEHLGQSHHHPAACHTVLAEVLIHGRASRKYSGCKTGFRAVDGMGTDEQAWQTYINFELRYKEVDRARSIYQRFLHVHGHEYRNWVRYAKFEERHGYVGNSRAVYEQALEYFGEENLNENVLIAFAQFEERQKESAEILKCLTLHEKKFGERVRIDNVVVSKRRHQYEQQVSENPFNYDAWFDYIRLLMNEEEMERTEVEDCFERAIANVPPYMEKRFWRRYIWLWIYYAVYEEVDVEDVDKCREVYRACLDIIPHKKFTFARIWVMFAQFEVRQLDVSAARKIMNCRCVNRSFSNALREVLGVLCDNSMTWIKFSELENERAAKFDMPEILWKAYIDFESITENMTGSEYCMKACFRGLLTLRCGLVGRI